MDQEKQLLIDDSLEKERTDESLLPRKRTLLNNIPAYLIHILLLSLYTSIFIITTFRNKKEPTTALHPISNLKIQYHPSTYTDFEISPFAGPPSPSVDEAWHELLSSITLRVTEAELNESNQSSVALPAGGYMAWLGVYHQLHCIKMLRQWNYREYYHPGLKEEDRPHWDIHADHCLDILRSAAMCHADTTLTTFGWTDQPKPMLNTRPIEHRCVDWEALSESVAHRVVEREEIQAMRNPNITT